MLELKELYKTFNPGTINAKTALNGLSLTLNDGDFVTVIGGNGAGKSTMLNATAGTFFVDSGKVIIDGSDVTNLPEHKRAAFIGRVFQGPDDGHRPPRCGSKRTSPSPPAAASAAVFPGRDEGGKRSSTASCSAVSASALSPA